MADYFSNTLNVLGAYSDIVFLKDAQHSKPLRIVLTGVRNEEYNHATLPRGTLRAGILICCVWGYCYEHEQF